MNAFLLSSLPGHYLAVLRTYLEHGPAASLLCAQELGDQAVVLGMETLDLAKVHDEALRTLILPDISTATRAEMATQADLFFAEAILPIEKTHRIAREACEALSQVNQTLGQRTLDLAASQRDLQQGILDRKSAEAALESSQEVSSQLLKESRLLEQHLKNLAREILAANEVERKKMSLHLHDEIAQTLLGIHVKLLALKKDAAARNAGLNQEIATTQQLVEASVLTINQFANEYGPVHEG